MNEVRQYSLQGKLKITAVIKLETGMHIGAASDFAPIGAVDSPFVRDPLTHQPIIPGSSLKGKLRTLLAKSTTDKPFLRSIEEDSAKIKRLFGTAGKNAAQASRLLFYDCKLTETSLERFEQLETDTYIGEVKFENSIDRLTATANPRQLERVPAGAEFAFTLVYNVEIMDELEEDIELLTDGFQFLELDYLGGSGSRGYGRVSFHDFAVTAYSLDKSKEERLNKELPQIEAILKGSC